MARVALMREEVMYVVKKDEKSGRKGELMNVYCETLAKMEVLPMVSPGL